MSTNAPNADDLRTYFCDKLRESKSNKIQESVPEKPAVRDFSIPKEEVIDKKELKPISEAIQKKIHSIPIRRDIIKALMGK